jgi:hypothetical protein
VEGVRRGAVAAAIVCLCVGVACPASAKTLFDHITLSGPGLAERVRIAGDSHDSFVLMEASGFAELAYDDPSAKVSKSAPSEDLGPRYRVTYVQPTTILPDTRDERVAIMQYLYPLAKPHPLVYMPADQRGTTSGGGWFVANDALYRELRRLGVPSNQPATTTTSTDEVDISPRPIGLGLILTAVGAVLIASFLLTPRLRSAR